MPRRPRCAGRPPAVRSATSRWEADAASGPTSSAAHTLTAAAWGGQGAAPPRPPAIPTRPSHAPAPATRSHERRQPPRCPCRARHSPSRVSRPHLPRRARQGRGSGATSCRRSGGGASGSTTAPAAVARCPGSVAGTVKVWSARREHQHTRDERQCPPARGPRLCSAGWPCR